MGNNVNWKVKNLALTRSSSPYEKDHFDVELEGTINGAVCGDLVDISNALQKKLNEPETKRDDSLIAMTYSQYAACRKYILSKEKKPTLEIKKVIFNNPATIVIWADETKTVVKAQNNELFDPEKGLAMAITKKALGNEGNYFDTIKKHVTEYQDSVTVKKLTVDISVENALRRPLLMLKNLLRP